MSYSAGTKLSHTDETEKVTVLTDNHVMVTKGRYEGQRMPLGDWLILADGAPIQEDYIPFAQQREFELGTTWLCRNNAKQWRVAMQSERDIVQLISVYTTEDDDRQYASHRLERFPTRAEWINDWPANAIELTENPHHFPIGTTWTKESGGITRVAVQRRHYVVETKQIRDQMTTCYESYWANYDDWYYTADVAAPAPPELDTAILPPLPRSRMGSVDMTGWTEEEIDFYRHCEAQRYEDTDPDCRYCHPQSGCDGDHSAEEGEQRIWKGPAPVLTEQQAREWKEQQAWANVAHAGQQWFQAIAEQPVTAEPATPTTIVESKPNPRYNNRNWPSPRPALLAKELYGLKLKHVDALEHLAKANRCTVDEFLETPWTDLDLPLTAKELMAKCDRHSYYYGH
jgi:hypothetical protein